MMLDEDVSGEEIVIGERININRWDIDPIIDADNMMINIVWFFVYFSYSFNNRSHIYDIHWSNSRREEIIFAWVLELWLLMSFCV